MLEVVAEVETRGIAGREGFGTTPRMLSAMLRCSATEARTRTEQAALVGPRRAMTGQVLPPRVPATAAALAAGQIGAGQLKVITDTMAALPAPVPEPARERIEAALAGYARDFDPRRLRSIAHRRRANLDPDGREPREDPTPTALAVSRASLGKTCYATHPSRPRCSAGRDWRIPRPRPGCLVRRLPYRR